MRIKPFTAALISLLILGAGLRLFDLTDQPIDFHPTRQLRGAIVAHGIYYQWAPGIDDAARRQAAAFWSSTGQYEPSILEGLVAATYLLIGREAFWIARIYNTLFWLIGGLALLALARRIGMAQGEASESARTAAGIGALMALAYYLALPFGVQASRSFQPDPGMVMWMAVAAYAAWRWSESPDSWRWSLAAGAACGMTILTKAVAVYTIGGALAALAIYTFGRRAQERQTGSAASGFLRLAGQTLLGLLLSPQVWMIAFLAVVPTLVYYLSRQGRAAEYFSSWTLALSHLLLEPSFWAGWLNLMQELFNPLALIAALLGIGLARGRARALLLGLWLGYLAYGMFLPYQMDTHSYYHLQLVWLVPLSAASAVQRAVEYLHNRPASWRWAAALAALLVLAYASWQALIPLYGKDYRGEPAYWQGIAAYLPADGKIIALTQDYGYRLMYYGGRKVTLWPNRGEIKLSDLRGSSKEFEQFFAKRTRDKSYFLVTSFNQYDGQPALQQMLTATYPVLAEGPGYLIFDLTQGKP